MQRIGRTVPAPNNVVKMTDIIAHHAVNIDINMANTGISTVTRTGTKACGSRLIRNDILTMNTTLVNLDV